MITAAGVTQTNHYQGALQGESINWSGTAQSLLTSFESSTVTSVISFNGDTGVTQYLLRVNYQSHFLVLSTDLPYLSDCSNTLTTAAAATMYPDFECIFCGFFYTVEMILDQRHLHLLLK